MKTTAFYVEKYGGLIVGMIVGIVVVFFIKLDINNSNTFINSVPNVSICVFGFLLTMLSIILQGNSSIIKTLLSEEHKKTYDRFIKFTKRVISLSLVVTILSIVIGNVKITIIPSLENIIKIINSGWMFLYTTLFIWLFFDAFQFVNMFFNLMKKK